MNAYIVLMQWLFGSFILWTVAVLVRRLLHMDVDEASRHKLVGSLSQELQQIYSPIAQEIETQIAILGVTLNDAFGEREAGRDEMSWHVIRLARGDWERLKGLVTSLQDVLARFLPATREVTILRRIALRNFKSQVVRDRVPVYEFLDQLVLRAFIDIHVEQAPYQHSHSREDDAAEQPLH